MNYLFGLIVLLMSVAVSAKEINADQVKVAYTYNFLKHTEWPDESKLGEYNLLVVSKNESLKSMFSMLSSRKLLNDKKIRVTFYDGKTLPKVQAVYVDQQSGAAAQVDKFFYAYESDPVLLISDEYKDRKKVLINLVQNGDIIGFEINKANILNRGLKISPDLVLLGGTEIDVAKLYKSSQDELKEQKEAVAGLNQKINEKNAELSAKLQALAKQKEALEQQQQKIDFQNSTISKQLENIARQANTIERQQSELDAIRDNILQQKKQLAIEEGNVNEKENILLLLLDAQQEKQGEINQAQGELQALNVEIQTQKKNLIRKEEVITNQREMIGVLLLLGGIIVFLAVYVVRQNRRLDELAQTDSLTGLLNRRAFLPKFEEEIDRFGRYGSPLTVLLIDVDFFKSINDTLGHNAGDQVLKGIADILMGQTRKTDLCVRWGGEEFLVLARETDINRAAALAENLRHKVETHDFGFDRQVTVSIGVAAACMQCNADSMVHEADNALYSAKRKGRNRVETNQDT